jgi:hypothetical protein
MSIAKTRLSRCAQLKHRCRSGEWRVVARSG